MTPAWIFHSHALDKPAQANGRARFEVTPVLWNRTLFFDTAYDAIFAIDAVTGEQRWTYDPEVNREEPIYNLAARGVSLWHADRPSREVCGSDTVIVATLDRRLIARDASTGKACPRFGNNGSVDLTQGVKIAKLYLYEFTSPVTVVGDTIVVGSSVGDNQYTFVASGAIRGFDARTGQQKWSWEPIRWTKELPEGSTGSGNAWSILSGDAEHDLVFIPTGSPSVDFYGGTRPGDDRDADSIVALRASTGVKVWSFQFVHHDLWDYDTPSEPLLFTFRKTVPAVAVTTKTNMIFAFNRLTGEPLYPIEERPVAPSTVPGEKASPTQPFSTLPPLAPLTFSVDDIHLHDPAAQQYCVNIVKSLEYHGMFTPPSRKGSLIYPGSGGGSNWGSAAWDPSTSILYTRTISLPFVVRETPHPPEGSDIVSRVERKVYKNLPEWAGGPPLPLAKTFDTPDGGGTRDESPQHGTPYTLGRQGLLTPKTVPCGPQPFGSIVAINMDTGKKIFSVPHGDMVKGESGSLGLSGVIVTAGGLLFGAGTDDGLLRAYDSSNGKELWRSKLPGPAGVTPMTYQIGDKQFVVVSFGGFGASGAHDDGVIAFALPSKIPTVANQSKRAHSRR